MMQIIAIERPLMRVIMIPYDLDTEPQEVAIVVLRGISDNLIDGYEIVRKFDLPKQRVTLLLFKLEDN